ncbi:MAG: hypothetical protein LC791_09305 [Acidobacteria bacterium]|nr:hypothetical protein [Acidobacteriota bacterium]
MSAEYVRSKPTSRGAQRPDAQALIDAGNTSVRLPVAQRWGNVDTEAVRLFFNAELPAGEKSHAYAFGNYSRSDGDTDFFYRSPVARQDIFRSVPLTNQPGGPRFSFASIYPGGFTPLFATTIDDVSLTGGFTGVVGSGFVYDVSGGAAQDTLDYSLSNTVNASLGPASPTSFELGTVKQRETRLNADFVSPWKTGVFATPLNVAYGLEWRQETFIIQAGEPASWQPGPFELGRLHRPRDRRHRPPDTGRRGPLRGFF